jgi:NAD(P)-dependent dehydrogenase (short-subunit alcohol dehydrogenase family)
MRFFSPSHPQLSTIPQGKVAVVGSGAKNLGGLISRTLGAEGVSVVVHYNSDSIKDSAEDTVPAMKKAGSDAFAIRRAVGVGLSTGWIPILLSCN